MYTHARGRIQPLLARGVLSFMRVLWAAHIPAPSSEWELLRATPESLTKGPLDGTTVGGRAAQADGQRGRAEATWAECELRAALWSSSPPIPPHSFLCLVIGSFCLCPPGAVVGSWCGQAFLFPLLWLFIFPHSSFSLFTFLVSLSCGMWLEQWPVVIEFLPWQWGGFPTHCCYFYPV